MQETPAYRRKARAFEHSPWRATSPRRQVDAVLRQAVEAGGALVKPAADTFWGGYAGYFADPDGFLWETAWNPDMPDLAE